LCHESCIAACDDHVQNATEVSLEEFCRTFDVKGP
jgi:hypothetical protein